MWRCKRLEFVVDVRRLLWKMWCTVMRVTPAILWRHQAEAKLAAGGTLG